MIYFTSDLHLNDPTMLRLRGFCPIDLQLIDQWNNRVGRGDTVYVLGDFALSWGARDRTYIESALSCLHGTKILISGNHDRREVLKAPSWAKVTPYHEIKVTLPNGERRKIVMSHYPLLTWNGQRDGSWMLHGHCHGAIQSTNSRRHDVGVDANGFAPVALTKLAELLEPRTPNPEP